MSTLITTQTKMISPMYDILNSFDKEENKIIEEYDDELPPQVPLLRRTRRKTCNNCGRILGMVILSNEHTMMCVFCSEEIMKKSEKVQQSLIERKKVMEKKKVLLQDIIDIGLCPNRIRQTLLFETLEFFETE